MRQRSIPRKSRRRPPEAPAAARQSPQNHGGNALLMPGIPAHPRSDRKHQDRPVSPEVAGSSPVAPVENILQIGIFCCQHRRMRPPASRRPPAPIRHGRSAADRTPKVLQTAKFLSPVRRQARHWSAAIPRRSRARMTGLNERASERSRLYRVWGSCAPQWRKIRLRSSKATDSFS